MKIILAYSGGLDTSVLVHWYANSQNAEVITYCADVGQEEELDGLEEKALATGATAHRTLDLVDEFAILHWVSPRKVSFFPFSESGSWEEPVFSRRDIQSAKI